MAANAKQLKSLLLTGRYLISTMVFVFLAVAFQFPTGVSGGGNSMAQPDKGHEKVFATVETTVIEERLLTDGLKAYGRVVPAPGSARTLCIPFECRVGRIFVTEGEQVEKGQPLIELSPSPSSVFMMKSKENNMKAAKLQLDKVKERLPMRLATASELIQAEKEYNLALLQMKNLKAMKMAENIKINSKDDELVSRIYCREGQIIASGASLMEIVEKKRAEATIGVEPEDVFKVKAGQRVLLTPLNRQMPEQCTGSVRSISRAVNSSSRLIDVFVSIPADAGFLINEFVRAEIVIDRHKGLVAPRSALLPGKNGFVCFTVKDGTARKHVVNMGLEGKDYVEILSESIKPGDKIVATGNYELSDGMPVKITSEYRHPSGRTDEKNRPES